MKLLYIAQATFSVQAIAMKEDVNEKSIHIIALQEIENGYLLKYEVED